VAADDGRHVEVRPRPDRARDTSGSAIVAALPPAVGDARNGSGFWPARWHASRNPPAAASGGLRPREERV